MHKWYDPQKDIVRARIRKKDAACQIQAALNDDRVKTLIKIPDEHSFGPNGSHGIGDEGPKGSIFIP